MRTTRKPRMPRHRCMRLAEMAAAVATDADVIALAHEIRRVTRAAGGHWWKFGRRTADFLEARGELKSPLRLFARGNGKLPFFAWSVLPLVTCPGAGTCANWCYSFKAWRYPAPFFRMLINTVLERTAWGRAMIAAEWAKLPHGTDFRLYVDGDHATLETMAFWFATLNARSNIKTYGYSKSWHLFTAWGARNAFPDNYLLNLSSGSRFDDDPAMFTRVSELPCTRGTFTAVDGLSTHANYRPGHELELKQHLAELRERARALLGVDKVFACPGRCGTCTPKGHACGSRALAGVPIVIATQA